MFVLKYSVVVLIFVHIISVWIGRAIINFVESQNKFEMRFFFHWTKKYWCEDGYISRYISFEINMRHVNNMSGGDFTYIVVIALYCLQPELFKEKKR